MQRRQQPGFTLIELMVTLAILVILVLLAVPSFRGLIEKSRLRGAADDVVNLIGVGRAEAIKRQRNVTIAPRGTASAWCVGANRAADPTVGQPAPAAAACDCSTDATKCVLENRVSVATPQANSGITSNTVTGSITFNAQTGALFPVTTAPDVVTLSSPSGYALQITVSPLGQVAACVPTSSSFLAGYPSC